MNNYPRIKAEAALDTYVGCLCHRIQGADDRFNPHCHEYYEVFITVSGTVQHWVNGKIYNLPEGSLVFIRPDDIHGYIYEDNNIRKTEYINFCFTKETAQELFSYLSESFPSDILKKAPLPPMIVVSEEERQRILSLVSQLYSINWEDKDMLKIRARVILADLIARFSEKSLMSEKEKYPVWLSSLMGNMESPENFIAGTEKMTELSKRSKEHISRTMKKYVGVTPSEYVNSLRINYAVNLLINTDESVIDICYECGFQNLSHFYRCFKKREDISPKEFRQRFRK